MNQPLRTLKSIVRRGMVGFRSKIGGPPSLGIMPAVLLHGAGASGFDEVVIFGGIGLVVLGLIYMSWRAGRQRKRAGGDRRRDR